MITNRKEFKSFFIEMAKWTLANLDKPTNATKFTVKHTRTDGKTIDIAPKKIVELAHQLQFDQPLPVSKFSGGYETNNFLRRHGVEVTTL